MCEKWVILQTFVRASMGGFIVIFGYFFVCRGNIVGAREESGVNGG